MQVLRGQEKKRRARQIKKILHASAMPTPCHLQRNKTSKFQTEKQGFFCVHGQVEQVEQVKQVNQVNQVNQVHFLLFLRGVSFVYVILGHLCRVKQPPRGRCSIGRIGCVLFFCIFPFGTTSSIGVACKSCSMFSNGGTYYSTQHNRVRNIHHRKHARILGQRLPCPCHFSVRTDS